MGMNSGTSNPAAQKNVPEPWPTGASRSGTALSHAYAQIHAVPSETPRPLPVFCPAAKEGPTMSKIAILLAPGFADWEYGLIAGTGAPFYGIDVRFFGIGPAEITSQGGLTVRIPDGPDALAGWAPDVVAVIGGTIWEGADAPDAGDVLRSVHAGGATVAGICGGTLALARAGLLNDARHTSNAREFLSDNAEGYDGARYVDTPAAVTDGRIVTAPGTAPASFAAAVFAAAGLEEEHLAQFRAMLAAEYAAVEG
jgi:putative intracellular protease/amidase